MWPGVSGTSTPSVVRRGVGVPAERVDDGRGVAVDVGERELLGRDVVEEVLEGLVVEHQDLLGLDAQHVGGRRVDGDRAGGATLVGTHGRCYLLGSCPRAVSAVAGVELLIMSLREFTGGGGGTVRQRSTPQAADRHGREAIAERKRVGSRVGRL